MTSSDDTDAGGKAATALGDQVQAKGDKFQSPEVDKTGLVTITLFGRQYHIRSDKPELIFHLAFLVQSAVNEVKGERSDSELASLDTLVQASFRLALQLNNALEAEKGLKDYIGSLEKKLQELIELIDKSVGGP
ncbi:MAG: cell division protein ZapA [Deltaproteobacteria bacterium]|jgi:cell division protein ZapA (FtsZ GTPase activity inhibitor)|nr:cell division protein ZapA [Deltaproteobacteria bacterium]